MYGHVYLTVCQTHHMDQMDISQARCEHNSQEIWSFGS